MGPSSFSISISLSFVWTAGDDTIREMISQRWVRIIPVALIMYTISYIDRTNVSLALDPTSRTRCGIWRWMMR